MKKNKSMSCCIIDISTKIRFVSRAPGTTSLSSHVRLLLYAREVDEFRAEQRLASHPFVLQTAFL